MEQISTVPKAGDSLLMLAKKAARLMKNNESAAVLAQKRDISTADPVGAGLVASLGRPGGNVTGVAANSTEIVAKRLQLLREAVPKAARIALFVSNSVAGKLMVTEMRAAAKQMGFALVVQEHPATTDGLAAAFAAMQRERAQALIVQQGVGAD